MSHFLTAYTILKPQYDYIEGLLSGLDKDTASFFKHCLASTFIQARERAGKIPVPACLIQRRKRGAIKGRRELKARGLLNWEHADRSARKCREYIINPDVLQHFRALNPLGRNEESAFDEHNQIPKVNIFTGRPPSRQRKSSPRINGNPAPRLITEAISVFQDCYYDRPALIAHLKRIGETEDFYRIEAPYDFEKEEWTTPTAYYRRLNDEDCRDTIERDYRTQPHSQTGIIRFMPIYQAQGSGRISCRLQSASREMKYAIYHGVEGLNNYDLKSSQAVILSHFLREAHITCHWLETYLQSGDKQAYATRVGLTGDGAVDVWKKCLYALFMGARQPRNTLPGVKPESNTAIEKALLENQPDPKGYETLATSFNTETAPLVFALNQWHAHLMTVSPQSQSKGKKYVRNACGVPFCINPPKTDKNKVKRQLAAHMLQGLEACFIHHLTLLGAKYGYRPIGNEHDGLIVIGTIPTEAVEEAKGLSGLREGVILSLKNDFSEKSSLLLLDEDSEYMDIIV